MNFTAIILKKEAVEAAVSGLVICLLHSGYETNEYMTQLWKGTQFCLSLWHPHPSIPSEVLLQSRGYCSGTAVLSTIPTNAFAI